jgi:outer membrane protein OmpA-like peptidoglycan-associated protein
VSDAAQIVLADPVGMNEIPRGIERNNIKGGEFKMRHLFENEIMAFAVAIVVTTIFAAGCASTPTHVRTEAPKPEIVTAKVLPQPVSCSDGDKDGVCDANDRCPMKVGPQVAFGCPIDPCSGSPLLVLVQFEYDSSKMPAWKQGVQTMDPVLDAVAKAIAKDPSCNVCIIGHASEEGTAEYNDALSRRRASAVEDYLTDHGLSATRLPTTGMGERCQLVPENTLELNRRVEFRRLEPGKACPMDCSS